MNKKKNIRYGSIILHNNIFYLFLNTGSTHYKGYTNLYKLNNEFKAEFIKIIFKRPGHISHNLCLFKGKEKNTFFGIGGKNRNQEPWNDHLKCQKNGKKYRIGVYLLNSSNIYDWNIINNKEPIIYKNYPKNGVINFEEKYPLFDGKICCFYSEILNKYILYCRANIERGIRFVQYTTSNNLIKWSKFNVIKSDNFDNKKDNYYTFDCIEIFKLKIFFALVPYTNHLEKPSEYSVRKLISNDGVNWKDIGVLFYGKEIRQKNITRCNTHITGLYYNKNTNKLFIFLHHNYWTHKTSINLYTFNINNKSDLKKIYIKKKNKCLVFN